MCPAIYYVAIPRTICSYQAPKKSKFTPLFPIIMHYRKLILGWLLPASVCNSTQVPAEPLEYTAWPLRRTMRTRRPESGSGHSTKRPRGFPATVPEEKQLKLALLKKIINKVVVVVLAAAAAAGVGGVKQLFIPSRFSTSHSKE